MFLCFEACKPVGLYRVGLKTQQFVQHKTVDIVFTCRCIHGCAADQQTTPTGIPRRVCADYELRTLARVLKLVHRLNEICDQVLELES